MKKRIFYVLCCITLLATLLTGCFPFNIVQNIMQNNQSIGGADGPTSVIIADNTGNQPATESSESQRIGEAPFGYVDVPSDFMPFTNDVDLGEANLQYSDITGNNIVTLQYYDGSLADAETFAQTIAYVLQEDDEVDQESITGAMVTIDDREAYQIYCYYPNYNRYVVAWCFEDTSDGYLHYISVEFTPDNYYLFEMVEDTYHLDH